MRVSVRQGNTQRTSCSNIALTVVDEAPAPKTKYEKLEGRIGGRCCYQDGGTGLINFSQAELEGLLRDMGTSVNPSHGNGGVTSATGSVRSSPEAGKRWNSSCAWVAADTRQMPPVGRVLELASGPTVPPAAHL